MDNTDFICKLECVKESLMVFEYNLAAEPLYAHAQTAYNINKQIINILVEMEE